MGEGDQLLIKWEFSFGEGNSTNDQSSLVRPFRLCLMEGKPPGKIIPLFYKEGDKHYLLGSLCWTEGNRLLFFPTGDLGKLVSHKGQDYENSGFYIDHITLEKDNLGVHISAKDKQSSPTLQSGKILQVNDSFLWFTLQARSPNDFERAPRIHETTITGTSDQMNRRGNYIADSQKDTEWTITYVNESLKVPHFINFEFFVCFGDNDTEKLNKIPPFIYEPEIPSSNLGKGIGTSFSISIQGFSGTIKIRISKVPGSNKTPWKMYMGNDFKKL